MEGEHRVLHRGGGRDEGTVWELEADHVQGSACV